MGVLGMGGGGAELAPCCCWFDLSLMSSQHMAAPSALQGPAQLPAAQPTDSAAAAAHSEKSQFPRCTVRFTRGKSHFPGRAAGSASLPSLAGCHGHRWRSWATSLPHPAPHFPPPGDLSPCPKSPASLSSAGTWPQPGPGLCCPGRGGKDCCPQRMLTGDTSLACLPQLLLPRSRAPALVEGLRDWRALMVVCACVRGGGVSATRR